jgi:hypothetical protein
MGEFSVRFFTDDLDLNNIEWEIREILSAISDDVRDGEMSGVCVDKHGDYAGGWTWNE